MRSTFTVTITISVDTPDGVMPDIAVRTQPAAVWAETSQPALMGSGMDDADALRAAVKTLAPVSMEFVRIVAERAIEGDAVALDMDVVRRLGFEDGRFAGGAIGAAYNKLCKAVGGKREPLRRLSENPPIWMMTKEDAAIVLEALG